MTDKLLKIVTNNPYLSQEGEKIPHEVLLVEGSPVDVLGKTEELLQQGWKLKSTPLPPNIPIMRGPYRSLIVEKADRQYDSCGIIALNKARERYIAERKIATSSEGVDFASIDATMLSRALRDLSLLENI